MAFISTLHIRTVTPFTNSFTSATTQTTRLPTGSSPHLRSRSSPHPFNISTRTRTRIRTSTATPTMTSTPSPLTIDLSAARDTLPPAVVPTPLPNVYVYDHCPFCVRVRHVLGMKNVKYNLVWLLNDDVDTPTVLVGKKMVPIFSSTPLTAMGESLDICKFIDSDDIYGPVGLVKAATGRTDIDDALNAIAMPLRRLTRVRFSRALLPEFTFEDARQAYIRNHAIKEEPTSYEENFQRSDEWISAVQAGIDQMDDMIYSKECVSEGGFSYDDVVTFAKLRALTIIKGLTIPKKMKEYIEWQSACAQIPLYYNYAM